MKIKLFYGLEKLNKEEEKLLFAKISENGFELVDKDEDYLLVIGGDGALIAAIRENFEDLDKTKILLLSKGTLCFLYDYSFEEIDNLFDDLKKGKLFAKTQRLLEGKFNLPANSKPISNIYALNEIRIENPFHTLICEVEIDGNKLETYHGNGLVVSTSVGSSAYNKSLGGALIEEDLSLLELTEIATIQNNVYRSLGSSLVLNGDRKIRFNCDFTKVVVGCDHKHLQIENCKSLEISLSDKKVSIMRKDENTYLDRIKRSFIKC